MGDWCLNLCVCVLYTLCIYIFDQITGETVGEVKPVADMHQRKAEMARHSDCFIALPGPIYHLYPNLSLASIYIYIYISWNFKWKVILVFFFFFFI